MYQSIITRLRVNSKVNSSKVKDDVQANKSYSKDGAKPKMLNNLLILLVGKMFQGKIWCC